MKVWIIKDFYRLNQRVHERRVMFFTSIKGSTYTIKMYIINVRNKRTCTSIASREARRMNVSS